MGLLSKKKKNEWVEVAGIDDFTVSMQVNLGRHDYTLYKVDGEVYCTQGSCSHEFSPLCDGIVMDGKVFCEKHGSRFDIRSGKVIDLPATQDLKTYEVKVEDGRISIKQ